VRLGDLARTRPISDRWGFDRGTPIDRAYIEAFLDLHRGDVRGRVLELADDTYARRFGDGVTSVDVLSATLGTPGATIVADLADAPQIPDGSFDCAIVTQTLQYVPDLRAAIATLHRILAPGGVVLASVPCVQALDRASWPDLWRMTPEAVGRLFGASFGEGEVDVVARGNVLAGAAFLFGLAAEEVDALVPGALATDDPRAPVTVCVRARRSA
jgi:SAM-dependent methyltransferase